MSKKKKFGIILIALILYVGVGIVQNKQQIDEFLKPFGRTPFELVVRDFIVATVAHIKAGDDIPFEVVYDYLEMDWNKIDYSRCRSLTHSTWGIQTNSLWLADKVRMIVPYYAYEGVREEPRYPQHILFYPYAKDKSFHILGQAGVEQGFVIINERFILDPNKRDLRQLYATLVHEMIHQQQGSFSGWVASDIEPRTQAATVEVLAAMCHYRDDVACKAFWSEIESYAKGSLIMRLRMYGYEDWYDIVANLIWRDSADEMARDKSLRHWMLDESLRRYYYEIINNYQKSPWEDLVIEGICGKGLETGFLVEALESTPEHPLYYKAVMMFDDTTAMLGNTLTNMICNMPHGPEVH